MDKIIKAGQILRSHRKELGYSQEEVAFRADLNRTFIGEIERDIAQPTVDSLFKIGRALKIRPSDLLKEMEENLEVKDKFWVKGE